MMKSIKWFILLLAVNIVNPVWLPAQNISPGQNQTNNKEKYSAWLFVYFTGNNKDAEAIRFAISNDGYNFRALNHNEPVLSPKAISQTGGVRDPHILRSVDGKTFYMVATDMVAANGWNSNRGMVLLKSKDLIHWTSSPVHFPKRFSGQDSLLRVWAPQTIYDPAAKKYMIYFSMKHGVNDPDKIYYAYANNDFTDLETEPKQLFFSPTNGASIDADIIPNNGKYYMFFKTEGEGAGIKIAVSDKLTEGYVLQDKYVQQTPYPVEGAGVYPLNNKDYVLMYDVYTTGRYQFTQTTDFKNFTVIDDKVTMNFRPRHGTVIPITAAEEERLVKQWYFPEDVVLSALSASIKKINVAFDTANKKVVLPVKPNTALNAFNPKFIIFPGVTITPTGAQNFSKPIRYTVTIKGQKPQVFEVAVKEYHNAAIEGYYADPFIMYSKKTGRFYIYPTSDGFNNWGGTYFKTFSSMDLVNWKDEGVILDLNKDVSWAKKNAWAPAIAEKTINGVYKYFYYFCAAQKIGVAVADNPAGPFTDLGKPLIDKHPEGVNRGQQIDPDVFTDPKTGKSYLYWGNGYMAAAELNDDMVSLKPGTTKIMTPDATFREGAHVFFRNGIYYFMWSEDDTRSENYRVRYAMSDSPMGPLKIPENNLVIAKDKETGIYGTGHHSVIQIPGKDEWYIVYHRFNYPQGIKMGDAAGYNREVCIDKMEFNADGTIKQAKPTHEGIQPVRVKTN
jgi:arabinoxylan arabinofuranohydrolase